MYKCTEPTRSYEDERPVEDVENEEGNGEEYPTALVDPLGDLLRRHGRERVELGEGSSSLELLGRRRCRRRRRRRRLAVYRHHATDRVVLLVVYFHRRHGYRAREALQS